MANINFNQKVRYDGGQDSYTLQMKHRRFPWWVLSLLLIPLGIYTYKEYDLDKPEEIVEDVEEEVVEEVVEEIVDDIWQGDTPLPEPTKNCGVHFSGLILSDEASEVGIAVIFGNDACGEYVGKGSYPDNAKAFPNAVRSTFDAIAIDKGTRLIIYSEPNFEGNVVLDMDGPMLVSNVKWKNDSRYNLVSDKTFTPELQALFPLERRQWSSDDMHGWSYGSCKIICKKCSEQ